LVFAAETLDQATNFHVRVAASEKAVPVVHQPSWSAFQGSTGDNATENPFVQAPVVAGADADTGEDTKVRLAALT